MERKETAQIIVVVTMGILAFLIMTLLIDLYLVSAAERKTGMSATVPGWATATIDGTEAIILTNATEITVNGKKCYCE